MKVKVEQGYSLRRRLLAGSLIWVLLTIAVAGWGLRALFVEHITRQLQAHLLSELDHLSAVVDWSAQTGVVLAATASDPRLSQPLSGLYWQIDQLGSSPRPAVLRSRSLWDQVLSLPVLPQTARQRGDLVLYLTNEQGHALLTLVRTLQLPDADVPPLRLVVAGDEALLSEPLDRFSRMLGLALGDAGTGPGAGGGVTVASGFAPLAWLASGACGRS